uniref:Uncharacterized protein n=1 Tax=Tetraselmis sp. GSL018 TaxID=582737 RepID=A0A061SJX0_9CHLO
MHGRVGQVVEPTAQEQGEVRVCLLGAQLKEFRNNTFRKVAPEPSVPTPLASSQLLVFTSSQLPDSVLIVKANRYC